MDLSFILLVITLGGLFMIFYKDMKTLRKRKKFLKNPELHDIPKFIISSKKMNFLDKRLSVNPGSIDVSSNNKIVLHLNNEKGYLEVKKSLRRKIVNFSEIKFILLEYEQYEELFTLKELLGGTVAYNKEIWTIRIIAVLKNDRELNLLNAKFHESQLEKWEEQRITGGYQEKSFLGHGKAIIRLLSNFMDKKYLIIDYNDGNVRRY
ncbi:hypothetical protein [Cytophaga sp. FL35]|uniref:hypothetical protein n=1 Tax=Cytophaga sp. FL35 TaxID=1904456 RepID=UPI001653CD45|nr:hypothetical protein [Cytophaga sp. FL35]MBC7000862.1 hypothetical protein [Cytophaga sp. FL35]